MTFAAAIDDALSEAMAEDETILIFGEDVQMLRRNLFVRFGQQRVRNTPISESAFLGMAVGAAMAGLKPVVEIMLVDFLGVCIDALLNHAAKLAQFTGGSWSCPVVVRSACGGGYGDGGQHQQSLWGWISHIPGLSVVVPCTPADAGGLMLAALEADRPVVFLEHKLLSDYWLDYLGGASRKGVDFEVPAAAAQGPVPKPWQLTPIGKACIRKPGKDLSIISVGVGVHRSLEAADELQGLGFSAEIIDLRSISPLDQEVICASAAKTGRVLVVDEDYQHFGLSGEVAAVLLEQGISFTFERICTVDTIPYARTLEHQVLPNKERIVAGAKRLLGAL